MKTKKFKTSPIAGIVTDYSTEVPFDIPCTTAQTTLTSNDALTVKADSAFRRHIPGNGAIYRLFGNGTHIPTLSSPFKKSSSSGDYVNTAGTLNLITFLFDGVDYWYSIIQPA